MCAFVWVRTHQRANLEVGSLLLLWVLGVEVRSSGLSSRCFYLLRSPRAISAVRWVPFLWNSLACHPECPKENLWIWEVFWLHCESQSCVGPCNGDFKLPTSHSLESPGKTGTVRGQDCWGPCLGEIFLSRLIDVVRPGLRVSSTIPWIWVYRVKKEEVSWTRYAFLLPPSLTVAMTRCWCFELQPRQPHSDGLWLGIVRRMNLLPVTLSKRSIRATRRETRAVFN